MGPKPLPGGLSWAKVILNLVVILSIGGLIIYAAVDDQEPSTPDDRAVTSLGWDLGKVQFGVQLDWQNDSPRAYIDRTGRRPRLFGDYVRFPFEPETLTWLDTKMEQVHAAGGVFMLTLEPFAGLGAVSDDALRQLTESLQKWNNAGVPVLVRFAHEMNGTWYPWGQQPTEYIATFRRVANAVRAAPGSRTLWSPNDGTSYPFTRSNRAAPSQPDLDLLDTNRDGALDAADDPYQPYYPGDEYVDWVGLTLYHFGYRYPWGANTIPEPDKFVRKITGDYPDPETSTRSPNFYELYAVRHHKPMAISETSALFNAARCCDGPSNLEIKTAWWRQITADDIPTRFPALRLITWFEEDKREADAAGALVSWSITTDPQIRKSITGTVPAWLEFPDSGAPIRSTK